MTRFVTSSTSASTGTQTQSPVLVGSSLTPSRASVPTVTKPTGRVAHQGTCSNSGVLTPLFSLSMSTQDILIQTIASSSTFALREKHEEMVAVTEVSLIPTPLLVKGKGGWPLWQLVQPNIHRVTQQARTNSASTTCAGLQYQIPARRGIKLKPA